MSEENIRSCFGRFTEWAKSPTAAIYANYVMSSWGDRMWHFAVGLYLVFFEDGVLLLAAALNFSSSGTVLLFGGIIGDWVDRNPRMKVIRIALVVQNLSVALSALSVCVMLHYDDTLYGTSRYLAEAAIITLAVIGDLASVAYKISVGKDWIVVVSGGNPNALANLNAVTRSLDLGSKVLSPALVGLIMSLVSLLAGALFIAAWNLMSVVVEYALLRRVYKLVPRLAYKEKAEKNGNDKKTVEDDKEPPMEELKDLSGDADQEETNQNKSDQRNPSLPTENQESADRLVANGSQETKVKDADEDEELMRKVKDDENKKEKKGCVRTMFDPFITLVRGWHIYVRQTVVFAGVSLACLFTTVLGFDSVSVGYLYALGLSELALGLAMAACGVTGIIATFLFTRFRKCMGLERTGVLAFSLQISCLLFCLVSVWAPGSPFEPNYFHKRSEVESQNPNCREDGKSTICTVSDPLPEGLNQTIDSAIRNSAAYAAVHNDSLSSGNKTAESLDKTSAILFVVGVITSRVGLWMADLTVTQLLQENVIETERGVVNGVQSSLNMLLFLLITLVVFVLPYIETFGYLIIISFCAICTGGCFFLVHAYRVNRTRSHQGRGCCGTCCYDDEIDTTLDTSRTSKA